MFDGQGKTVIIADSFGEEFELPTLTPRQKVRIFVLGILDNATDLVSFRLAPETAKEVAAFEVEIWQAMNALQMVATSIQIEKNTPTLRVVK